MSGTVRVLSGGAAQGLVEALRRDFEAATGRNIEATYGAVGVIRDRLLKGEAADLVILTRALIDKLAADGHVAADSTADLGVIETAVAVRLGDRLPEIGTAGQLRDALLAADAIHFPDPEQATAGIHFGRVLRELAVAHDVAGRLNLAPNGATAMRALATSKNARPIGCTQATEILSTPGVALVGPLPPGCELATVYTAAMTARATSPDSVRGLIARLTNETDRPARRKLGFL
jgi:molybdate transport system substrate-binding protein